MSKYNVITFIVEGKAPYFTVLEGIPKNPSAYFSVAAFIAEDVVIKYYYAPDCDMESFFISANPFDWRPRTTRH